MPADVKAWVKACRALGATGIFPCDERSGTSAFDYSGNSNTATYGSGVTLAQRTPFGLGVKLNQTDNDYVNIPHLSSYSLGTSGGLTVAAAINITSWRGTGFSFLVTKQDSGVTIDWRVYQNASGGVVTHEVAATGNSTDITQTLFPVGRWGLWVAQWPSGSTRANVNLMGRVPPPTTGGAGSATSTTGAVRFGHDPANAGRSTAMQIARIILIPRPVNFSAVLQAYSGCGLT